jgi:tetratricopeptide (TPR) repeat protein
MIKREHETNENNETNEKVITSFVCSVLLFVCFVFSLPAQIEAQDSRSNPETILARALQLHQSGDFEGAIREYQAFLALRPERYDIRSNLGAAYARLGRYQDAIDQYQRALKLDRRNPDIRFNLAVAYYKAARVDLAADELERLVADQPEQQKALQNAQMLLADCYLQMGENRKVIELMQPLADQKPDDLGVAYLLGTAFARDGQSEKGQIFIEKIMRRGDSAEARLMMGTTYMMITDYAKAVPELERAVKMNPKLPSANGWLGKALMATGNTDAAQESFRRELEINPNDFDSNLQMGILRKQDQQYREALEYFQKAQMVRPNEPNSRFYIASIEVAEGKFDQARQRLEEVVKDAPDFVEAHVMLATAYYRLRRKADGDRHQAIVNKLNAERQAKQPGAQQKP